MPSPVDKTPYTGIVDDPSQPSRTLMPPPGMTVTPAQRAFLVEQYGEDAVAQWERQSADLKQGNGLLSDDDMDEMLRDLGYDV